MKDLFKKKNTGLFFLGVTILLTMISTLCEYLLNFNHYEKLIVNCEQLLGNLTRVSSSKSGLSFLPFYIDLALDKKTFSKIALAINPWRNWDKNNQNRPIIIVKNQYQINLRPVLAETSSPNSTISTHQDSLVIYLGLSTIFLSLILIIMSLNLKKALQENKNINQYKELFQRLPQGYLPDVDEVKYHLDEGLFKVLINISNDLVLEGKYLYPIVHIEPLTAEALVKQSLEIEIYHALINNIHQVVWLWSREEHKLVYISPKYEQIWGRSSANLADNFLALTDLIAPEEQPKIRENYQQILSNVIPENCQQEYRLIRDDGKVCWIREQIIDICHQPGKMSAIMGIMEEITEYKQMEQSGHKEIENLQQLNRLKDEFLAMTSHELRTPLNSILGWSNLLRNRTLDAATTQRALETIERNARAQKKLIEDLLDLSRIIRGTIRLESDKVEINRLMEEAIHTLQASAEVKGITVVFIGEDGEVFVWGDSSRLQQVFWNLLSNAIKFTPNGGLVEVRLSVINHNYPPIMKLVKIEVQDTGIGICPEFLPFIFEQYHQENNPVVRGKGGLGLGLAIARKLVELHQGEIFAVSGGEGQGATFTVKLPVFSE